MQEEQRLRYLAAMGVPVWVARDQPSQSPPAADSPVAGDQYLCLASGDSPPAGACWMLVADRGELDAALTRSLKLALESVLDEGLPVALAAPESRLKPGSVTVDEWRQSQPKAVLAFGHRAARSCAEQLHLEPLVAPALQELRDSPDQRRECLARMLELAGASDPSANG